MIELKNKKIIIATHISVTGPAHDQRDYLLQQHVGALLFVFHPLFFLGKWRGDVHSGYERYDDTKKTKVYRSSIKRKSEVFSYMIDFFSNIFWTIINSTTWDLYIGHNNLNTLSGIILRWLGVVKKVVYYVIDYNPKRYRSRFLNVFYHYIDQFCVRHADETWNLSGKMIEARREFFGFTGGNQKVVPIGIWFHRIPRKDFSQVKKHQLVFMGGVHKQVGLQHVLKAVPMILQVIPDFHFLIIGAGEYIPVLQSLAKDLKIEAFLEWTGYVEKHEDIERMLATSGVAVALYEKYLENGELNYTGFTDPGKLKSYLGSGLPVVLTDVPPNAHEIQEKKCGRIVEYDPKSIAQAIIELMGDDEKLRIYKKNAIDYAQQFDWNLLFGTHLRRVL